VPGWASTSSQTMITYTSGTVEDVQLGRFANGRFAASDITGSPFYANGRGFIFMDSPVYRTRNVATSGTNYAGGQPGFQASYWNGSSGVDDFFYLQNVPQATGANPQMVLQLTHAGSTGFPHGFDIGTLWLNPLSDLQIGSSSTGTRRVGINTNTGGAGAFLQINGLSNVYQSFAVTGTLIGFLGQGSTLLSGAGGSDFAIAVNGANHLWLGANGVKTVDVTSGAAAITGALSSTSLAGSGTATFAAGAAAGTSPGTPTCTTSHVCDSQSGTVSFTMGTATTTGIALTVTTSATRTNQPNCSVAMYLAASPYTAVPIRATYTTTTIVFNAGTAPTASTAYELVYSGCGGK
jgi:hypothetical protein